MVARFWYSRNMKRPQNSHQYENEPDGVPTDQEFTASVTALEKSMEEVRQGRTRLLTEALDEIGRRYESTR